MSRQEDRAESIKMHRNLLLSNLRRLWPGTMEGEQLFRSMLGCFPEYERLWCFKDLAYLEGKTYVERVDPRSGKTRNDGEPKWDVARWRLTVRGTEHADGLLADPALEP